MLHVFVNGACITCGESLDWLVDRHQIWGDVTQCEGQRTLQLTMAVYEAKGGGLS